MLLVVGILFKLIKIKKSEFYGIRQLGSLFDDIQRFDVGCAEGDQLEDLVGTWNLVGTSSCKKEDSNTLNAHPTFPAF